MVIKTETFSLLTKTNLPSFSQMYIFCNLSSFVSCYFFFETGSKKIFIHIRALKYDDLFFLKDIKVSSFKWVLLQNLISEGNLEHFCSIIHIQLPFLPNYLFLSQIEISTIVYGAVIVLLGDWEYDNIKKKILLDTTTDGLSFVWVFPKG